MQPDVDFLMIGFQFSVSPAKIHAKVELACASTSFQWRIEPKGHAVLEGDRLGHRLLR